ncbi:MAG: hypothetical protein JW940_26215 [Polyangiaceae bacterium]|nr:hypothetical protein [Polyangiaceae bacterium]
MEPRLGRTLAVFVSSLAVAGCAASVGFLRDSVTQVQVKHANFRIVKTGVTATADTGKALCLFPTDDAQVYRRLMENLHASAKLGPNQMLVNLREDIKMTFYFVFYCSEQHTLSADVVEFVPEGTATALPPAPPPPTAMPSAPPPAPAAPTGVAGQLPDPANAPPQNPAVAPAAEKR